MVIDGAFMTLLVMPIRVFGMLQVPQRPPASDLRKPGEVVRRRWRTGGPFERPRIPGIVPGDGAAEVRPQQVAGKNQDAGGLKEYTDGHDEIPDVPTAAWLVGIDPARHPQNAGDVHEV